MPMWPRSQQKNCPPNSKFYLGNLEPKRWSTVIGNTKCLVDLLIKNKIKIRQSLKLMPSRYFVIHVSTHSYAHNQLFIHALNKHLQAAFFFNIKSYKMRNTLKKKKKKKKQNDKRYSIKLNQSLTRTMHRKATNFFQMM